MKMLCIENDAMMINMADVKSIYANDRQVLINLFDGMQYSVAIVADVDAAKELVADITIRFNNADTLLIRNPTPDTVEIIS